jgi:hypothetical protein
VSAQQRSGREPADELDEVLRRSLRDAGAGFDYDALVSGVHQRAHRIRVRRTVTTLAAAAVFGPALVGGALTLPNLVGDDVGTAPPAGTDDTVATVTEDGPPYQDGELPLPPGGEDFAAIENAWEIPDARPTGVALLEEGRPPQSLSNYPRIPVLTGLMVCDPGNPGGVEPLAGQTWHYAPGEDEPGSMWESVDIQVTGWADGEAAMEGLRDDALLCAWDTGPDGEPLQSEVPWPGKADDPDYYLNEPFRFEGFGEEVWVGAAAAQAGDYVVGVTVKHVDPETAAASAQEIADKTAANLTYLDPERAGD